MIVNRACSRCGKRPARSRRKMCQRCADQGNARNALPKVKEQQRRSDLRRRYNLTPEGYQDLLDSQDGLCAICGRLPEPGRNLMIDHDHTCCNQSTSCGNCIRGLLCGRCNKALGLLGDTAESVQRAVDYLKEA